MISKKNAKFLIQFHNSDPESLLKFCQDYSQDREMSFQLLKDGLAVSPSKKSTGPSNPKSVEDFPWRIFYQRKSIQDVTQDLTDRFDLPHLRYANKIWKLGAHGKTPDLLAQTMAERMMTILI